MYTNNMYMYKFYRPLLHVDLWSSDSSPLESYGKLKNCQHFTVTLAQYYYNG